MPIAGAVIGAGAAIYGANKQAKAAKQSAAAASDASDPRRYPNIRIPGFEYQEGTPVVDMPAYPNMPILPTNMPLLNAPRLANATSGEMSMNRALSQAEAANLSLLNPNSSVFRSLAAEEEQLANQDFLKGIRSLMTMNNRAGNRGRALFDRERGGEQVMSAILNNARDANLNSRLRARGILGDTAARLINTASGYGQVANLETGRRNALREDQLTRINMMRDDAATRNSQQRGDTLGKYNDSRENIIAALNLYRNNQATLSREQEKAENYRRQDTAAQMQGVKDAAGAFSGFFGGGASNFSSGSSIPGFNSSSSLPAGYGTQGTTVSGMPWLNG